MMNKKLRLGLIFGVLALLVLSTATIIFISNYEPIVFLQNFPDKNIVVQIRSCDGLFGVGMMGGYEYRLIVKRDDLFASNLMDTKFIFSNDGSTLSKENVEIRLKENNLLIIVDSEEMNAKTFVVSC